MVAMAWEKETRFDRFRNYDTSLDLPGEAVWRYYREARGRSCSLPSVKVTPQDFLQALYIKHAALLRERQELMELATVRTQILLAHSIVAAAAGSKEGISAKTLDMIHTLLWSVQKVTNPMAVRPVSKSSDDLVQELEKMRSLFESGPLEIYT